MDSLGWSVKLRVTPMLGLPLRMVSGSSLCFVKPPIVIVLLTTQSLKTSWALTSRVMILEPLESMVCVNVVSASVLSSGGRVTEKEQSPLGRSWLNSVNV